jgi:mannose-6-phosphate isomerase-like protein (cupin superfamily)
MPEPIIVNHLGSSSQQILLAATGESFEIHEWRGSGPDYLHVHHSDDEAWHVLEGTLTFRFVDRQVEASAGTTVFVPAGVPHTYFVAGKPTRYLIILTPRLRALIEALHSTPREQHGAVMKQFDSAILS